MQKSFTEFLAFRGVTHDPFVAEPAKPVDVLHLGRARDLHGVLEFVGEKRGLLSHLLAGVNRHSQPSHAAPAADERQLRPPVGDPVALVREITPADRAGRIMAFWALTTPDGKAFAYSTNIWQSELHLIEGLR